MKTTLFLLCLLVTTTAFAQVPGGISADAHPMVMADHPQHADMRPMAVEQTLVGGTGQTSAHGERPLWEFGSPFPPERPLGDVARDFRQVKLTAKKASLVLEKQGR